MRPLCDPFAPPPAPIFTCRPGDTWAFPTFTFVDPAGAAIDLTGSLIEASLYLRGLPAPFPLTGVNGNVVFGSSSLGQFAVTALPLVTAQAPPDPAGSSAYPTELCLVLVDALGRRTTLAVITIRVPSPREPTPATAGTPDTAAVLQLVAGPSLVIKAADLQGPAGPTGGATLVYTQIDPLLTWTINHGLNRFPSVTVIDTAGDQVLANVTYLDRAGLTIAFSAPSSGTAYLN